MSDLLEQWRDPVFDDRHTQVPAALASRLTDMADEIVGRHIYYERMHVLLAVAGIARITQPTRFQLDNPPSDAERRLGAVLGQAFHQGCQLADIALAAGLSNDQVVAIGRRTIRRTGWLKHI
jgi:hypothetical protein